MFKINVVLAFALLSVLTLAACEKKPAQQASSTTQELGNSIEKVAKDAGKQIEQTAQTATTQIQNIQQQAGEQVNQLQEQAANTTSEAQSKTAELIAQAQQFLNSGKYQEAITAAQEVLSKYDPNSTLAQNIIKQAQDGIAGLANKTGQAVQAQATTTMQNLKGTLDSYGQK